MILMDNPWVVVLDTGGGPVIFGPLNATDAGEFCAYLCAEVDPAKRYPLRSPTKELLTFWRSNKCTCLNVTAPGVDGLELMPGTVPCPVHPRPDGSTQ